MMNETWHHYLGLKLNMALLSKLEINIAGKYTHEIIGTDINID